MLSSALSSYKSYLFHVFGRLIEDLNSGKDKSVIHCCPFLKKNYGHVHSFSKETQLFFMEFSWGPGSGSCDPGPWEICILVFITPYSLVYTLLQKKGNFKKVAFILRLSVVGVMPKEARVGWCQARLFGMTRTNILVWNNTYGYILGNILCRARPTLPA